MRSYDNHNPNGKKGRTWQQNAAEFAELDSGDGWPFAILVACSVERGTHGGARRGSSFDRNLNGKVNATTFAKEANTSPARVLRFLAAWDAAAKKGLCPPTGELSPADVNTTAYPDAPFKGIVDGVKGVYTETHADVNRDRIARSARSLLRKDPAAAEELVKDPEVLHAILASPAVKQQVREEVTQAEARTAARLRKEQDARIAESVAEAVAAEEARAADTPADRKAARAALHDEFAPLMGALAALGLGVGIEPAVDAINRFAEGLRTATLGEATRAEANELARKLEAAMDNLRLAFMEVEMRDGVK